MNLSPYLDNLLIRLTVITGYVMLIAKEAFLSIVMGESPIPPPEEVVHAIPHLRRRVPTIGVDPLSEVWRGDSRQPSWSKTKMGGFLYYPCGAFRNKGSNVCSANSIRKQEAETEVMNQLTQVLSKDRILKAVVDKINH